MDVNAEANFYHTPDNPGVPCYIVNITNTGGLWQSENPLAQALPILAMQLAIAILITRVIQALLKPYHIPPIVANILGGICIGPTVFGRLRYFRNLFPLRSITMVETISYWSLTCHVYLLGLHTDVGSVLRAGKKAVHVAAGGVLFPLAAASAVYLILKGLKPPSNKRGRGHLIYFAAPLGMTGFPVVSRIMVDLKLIHSDFGRLAMSCALVEDLVGWIFVLLLFPYTVSLENMFLSVAATAAFILFCVFAVRPALAFVIRRTYRGSSSANELYLCFVMVSVSMFAFSTEVLGTGSLIGAFVFGVIMPDRALAGMLVDKFDDFFTNCMLPLYFTCCGLRTQLTGVIDNWLVVAVTILLACSLKVLGALITTSRYNIAQRDAFALGMLSNSKGILAVFIATLAFDRKILLDYEYATLILCILIMTAIGGPVVANMFKPAKRLSNYTQRTIQQAKPDSEIRVLACFHGPHNISGMINLLDSSATTEESTLNVYALHLVELTGRSSAMLIIHNPGKASRQDSHSDQIITALETFSNLNESIKVQILTGLSPFVTMHDDICSLAEDRLVNFVILPFHKPPTPDEEGNTSFRGVNHKVISEPPCTVCIFVDKGYGENFKDDNAPIGKRELAMLFFGGPDDREALALASRMAASGVVNLHVVRFESGVDQLVNLEFEQTTEMDHDPVHIVAGSGYIARQMTLDRTCLDEFRLRSAGHLNITYEEKVVNGEEDVISNLNELTKLLRIDLFLVGKGEVALQPMTAALLDWCEYPELGAIGDALATMSDSRSSVLVVQQYNGPVEDEEDENGRRGDGSEHLMVDVNDGSSVHSSGSREPIGKWQVPGDNRDRSGAAGERLPLARHKRDDGFI